MSIAWRWARSMSAQAGARCALRAAHVNKAPPKRVAPSPGGGGGRHGSHEARLAWRTRAARAAFSSKVRTRQSASPSVARRFAGGYYNGGLFGYWAEPTTGQEPRRARRRTFLDGRRRAQRRSAPACGATRLSGERISVVDDNCHDREGPTRNGSSRRTSRGGGSGSRVHAVNTSAKRQ